MTKAKIAEYEGKRALAILSTKRGGTLLIMDIDSTDKGEWAIVRCPDKSFHRLLLHSEADGYWFKFAGLTWHLADAIRVADPKEVSHV